MSDERDGAGSAGDVTDALDDVDGTGGEATGGRTVVASRPQRPSGKRVRRAVVRDAEDADDDAAEGDAAVTVSKNGSTAKAAKTAKSAKSSKGSRNPFAFVWNYLKQVVAELRKVIWPNRKQMVSYTTVVLVFLAFMVALIGLVDLGLAKLVMLVFG